jgi:hypoxanthine phosphoribosyltransferase
MAVIEEALAKKKLPDCDLVIGIAEGGEDAARLVASKIECDLKIIKFNYRDEKNVPRQPEPVLLSSINIPSNVKKILIVDDVSVSGKTMSAAKKLFKGYEVATMVFKGKADYVLFPEITDCIKWPWK